MRTLSFVIPLYNEQHRLQKTITALEAWKNPHGIKLQRVFFVNDGSTDKTTRLIKQAQKALGKKLKADVILLSSAKNKGKGFAIRKGMLASEADYTLFFDADMSTPLSQIERFLPFMAKGTPVIVGTRKNGKATVTKYQPLYRQILGKAFTTLSNIVTGVAVTDHTCGFKAFSRQAKNDIFPFSRINRWGYDSEILFLAKKAGYSLQEVPVLWANDEQSRVSVVTDVLRTLKELAFIRINNITNKYPFDSQIVATQVAARLPDTL